VNDAPVAVPVAEAPPDPAAPPAPPLPRWVAALEVLAVSGLPTQLALSVALLQLFGLPFTTDAESSLRFVSTLILLDSVVVLLLIGLFLRHSGERMRDVFLGARPVRSEAVRGLLLVPVAFVLVAAVVLLLRMAAPSLQTVEQNPFEALLGTTSGGLVFFVVAVTGGIREELQRAFILHRFGQRLGGTTVGLVAFSVLFAVLHVNQGVDVSIAIGLLGLVWGLAFIGRRSVVLPMANHAGFNGLQVLQALAVRTLGG